MRNPCIVILILYCSIFIVSCRKSENIRPQIQQELGYFTFQVMDVSSYCKDYRGRPTVLLKCLQYPEYSLEARMLSHMIKDSIFVSTAVPVDYLRNEKVFSATVNMYIDWPERAPCYASEFQINLENVE